MARLGADHVARASPDGYPGARRRLLRAPWPAARLLRGHRQGRRAGSRDHSHRRTRTHVADRSFRAIDDRASRRFFGDQFGGADAPGPRSFRQRGLGSGVIVTGDGYILTNNHVVDDADDIRVELHRRPNAQGEAGRHPTSRAIWRCSRSTQTSLPALTLGNSDAVQVGDVVLAVGNPLGIGQTVTMGIVSAKGRSTGAGDGGYEDFLQTDAPINHGNSGGALVNTKGELVGINSQIVSQSDGNIGIGFAIPANMARTYG